jgi:hypothetical protein
MNPDRDCRSAAIASTISGNAALRNQARTRDQTVDGATSAMSTPTPVLCVDEQTIDQKMMWSDNLAMGSYCRAPAP